MVRKIEALTPEQAAMLPAFRQRYLDIACGGHRADRPALAQAMADAYAEIRMPPPALFIFDSPAACMLAIKIFEMGEAGKFALGGQLWDQLRDQLWGQLGGRRIYSHNFLWGSHDLYWVAWAKFAKQIGVKFTTEQSRGLDIMGRIGGQCEWWWPFENIVIASQRPTFVKWDDERRLHSENGPAVEYADGYALAAWHGQSIPLGWTNGEPPTAKDALHWPNMDQRAAACEIVGWANILDQLDAKTIDDSGDPVWGRLVEVTLPDSGRERFLDAMCGTGRRFALPVPLETKTVDQAQSVLHGGLPPEILKFAVERT